MDTIAEPVWRGLLTCDYERTRPDATPLEWDLYTTSLINWPNTLMDDPAPYGRLRRPGIVDIPEADHHRLLARWHDALKQPAYVADLIQRTNTWTSQLTSTLSKLMRGPIGDTTQTRAALAHATRDLLTLNATHIVNWLLPEQQWHSELANLLGGHERASTCLLALSTPSQSGHLLDAHRQLLSAAEHIHTTDDVQQSAATFATTIGPVYGTASPSRAPLPLEDPDTAATHLSRASAGQPRRTRLAIDAARNRATAHRATWYAAAILAAAGDHRALHAVHTIAATCQWATDCEERRKELRHRYLATVRRWCTHTRTSVEQVTVGELLGGGAG